MQNNIEISNEYYQFLLKYGNSNFLKYGYANLTFDYIKLYLLDDEIPDDARLPQNCDYIGSDLSTEPLCLSHLDKNIYIFGNGEHDFWYYGGLRELLFYYLFGYIKYSEFFDNFEMNIKIDNIDGFKNEYLDYEIKNVHFGQKYFF